MDYYSYIILVWYEQDDEFYVVRTISDKSLDKHMYNKHTFDEMPDWLHTLVTEGYKNVLQSTNDQNSNNRSMFIIDATASFAPMVMLQGFNTIADSCVFLDSLGYTANNITDGPISVRISCNTNQLS